MSRILPVILLVFLLVSCTSPTPPVDQPFLSATPTLALVHATLIDGTGADPVADAVILLANDHILAVGPAATLKVPAGVDTLDLTGMTILPGFINAHVHKAFDKANLQAWAQGGVTTVRDEGASPAQIADLKDFQASINTEPVYARLVSAGSIMAVPGGYGSLYVDSPEQARQAALTEVGQGVSALKVALEDGYSGTTGLPKLTPAELQAIVTVAHASGLPVSAHITQGEYIQTLLDAGVDDIAHMAYDYVNPQVMQEMVDKGIYWIPTFTVYRNYGAPLVSLQNNLRQFVRLGGQVALGNDYGGGPGDFELGIPYYEIESMSGAGMTPMQIIQASTLNAARVLRLEMQIGTLEADKQADILVVQGNPLEDLQSLTQIRLVIHNGAIIRNEMQE